MADAEVSVEPVLVDGVVAELLVEGLVLLALISELVLPADGLLALVEGLVLPAAAVLPMLDVPAPLGEAADWDILLDVLPAAAGVVLPEVPMLLLVLLQWSEIMVTELTWKLLPVLEPAVLPVEVVELLLDVLLLPD